MTRRLLRPVLGLVGIGIAIGLWWLVAVSGMVPGRLVPTPPAVLEDVVDFFGDGDGWKALSASTVRVLLGVTIGMLLAIPVGFLMGWYSLVRAGVNPLMNFFRALPPIALIPLWIVYLGIGESARISVIVWTVFFVAVVMIAEGIAAVDPLYVRAARVLGASRREVFTKVVFPLSVPNILIALRVGLGVAWSTLVAAELLAAQEGLGATISIAANLFLIPRIYAGIILIGVVALLMDRAVSLATARLIRWQDRR